MIASVRLDNFCQHRHLEVDFHRGVNAILGPNGSGKSNLLAALAGALTGNFGNTLSKCIAWGAGEHPSGVQVCLQRPDGAWRLERWLQADARQPRWRLCSETSGREWVGEKPVREQLREMFGMEADMLRAHAFVDQWKVFEFLTAPPADRIRQLQEMLGLKHLERVWELLGDRIGILDRRGTEVADLERRRADSQAQVELLADNLRTAEQQLAELPVEEQFETLEAEALRVLGAWNHKRTLERELGPAAAQVTQRLEDEQATADLHGQLVREYTAAQRALAELPATAQELQDWQDALTRQEHFRVQQETLRNREQHCRDGLRYLEPKLAELPALTARCRQLLDDLQYLRAQLAALPGVEALQDGRNCPTCGTALQNVLQLRQHVAQQRRELTELHDGLEKDLHQITEKLAAAESAQREASTLQAMLEGLQEYRTTTAPPECFLNRPDLEFLQRQRQDAERRCQQLEREVALAEERLQGRRDLRRYAESSLEELTTSWRGCDVTEDRAARAEQELASLRHRREVRYAALVRIPELQASLACARDTLQADQTACAEARRRAVCRSHLQELRDVFHRSALPTLLLQGRFQDLDRQANEILELFETPFALRLDKTFNLQAHFADGKIMEARQLSGAEKVVSAFSLRASLGLLLGGRVGFLGLDEVAIGLDQRYLARLPDVMERIRLLAGKFGLQILMVTHEESLRPLFDHVVMLGGAGHG